MGGLLNQQGQWRAFQEAVVAPFSTQQVEDYVTQYVTLEPRPWLTKDHMRMLTTVSNLMNLVKGLILLTLALEPLPTITEVWQNLASVKTARVKLYHIFVVHWLEVNRRRLESNASSNYNRAAYD
ncbi:hypothetical protein BGX24_002806 [Mortierella sp. AD032]|nr:hypothetical protein BGX24_002806 [Mortierella sp. AD032]